MTQRIEFQLIDELKTLLGDPAFSTGNVSIGDDCAVIKQTSQTVQLVTADMLMDGTHFLCDQHSPDQIAAKLFGVNLSDIAAMGGIPTAVFLSIALPKSAGAEYAKSLFGAFARQSKRCQVPIWGGDTNSWNGPLVVNATVLGKATAAGPVLRSNGKPGDELYVSGPLGGSLTGRHLDPQPRLELGVWLAENFKPSAMIDLSDGLLADLEHLLGQNVHGAMLNAAQIPIHHDARAIQDGRTPLDHACNDGEDFELLFAISRTQIEDFERRIVAEPVCQGITRIGQLTAEQGVRLTDEQGKRVEIAKGGWTHQL